MNKIVGMLAILVAIAAGGYYVWDAQEQRRAADALAAERAIAETEAAAAEEAAAEAEAAARAAEEEAAAAQAAAGETEATAAAEAAADAADAAADAAAQAIDSAVRAVSQAADAAAEAAGRAADEAANAAAEAAEAAAELSDEGTAAQPTQPDATAAAFTSWDQSDLTQEDILARIEAAPVPGMLRNSLRTALDQAQNDPVARQAVLDQLRRALGQ